jgi:hypothetical protein
MIDHVAVALGLIMIVFCVGLYLWLVRPWRKQP